MVNQSVDVLSCPIFIGGTGRSGTTVLARILSLHPSVYSIRWESQFLVAPGGLLDLCFQQEVPTEVQWSTFFKKMAGYWFERVVRQGQPSEYKAGLCANFTEQDIARALLYLKSGSALADRMIHPEVVVRKFVELLMQRQVRAGHSNWLEKTPANLIHMDRLYSSFPNMRFINIMRNGRDVVASMLDRNIKPIAPHQRFPISEVWSGDLDFEKAIVYYAEVMKIGSKLKRLVSPENYCEIRLEDLVANPEAEITRLCNFIGIAPTEGMLSFDLSRSNSGRGRARFSNEELSRIEELAGDVMKQHGY